MRMRRQVAVGQDQPGRERQAPGRMDQHGPAHGQDLGRGTEEAIIKMDGGGDQSVLRRTRVQGATS